MDTGKGGDQNKAANRAIQSQTNLAERLVNQTDPLRQELTNQSTDFLRGDFDVSSLPQYSAAKNTIEQQFNRAKDNIIAGTPEGGGLTDALIDVEGARAGSLVNVEGALGETETNRALQLATGGAAQGSAGFGQAGQTAAQLALAESQQNAGKAAGLGSAAGRIGAAKVSGK
jgi:hypothetical protein